MGDRVQKHVEIISRDLRTRISYRYHVITKAINKEFWGSNSETTHSIYVGSYGRGTAVDTSDIDILVEIPQNEYERFDHMRGNGQSRLLQVVKEAILISYPRTTIKADGQVVVILFSDGMRIEIVPAFPKVPVWPSRKIEYAYPDTNNGGNWKSADPKAEQEAMKLKNNNSNGLLKDTCKHIRRVRDEKYNRYHLSGILIDSFVYAAIGTWKWANDSYDRPAEPFEYESALLSYFYQNKYGYLYAPGSFQEVSTNDYWVLEEILNYMVG